MRPKAGMVVNPTKKIKLGWKHIMSFLYKHINTFVLHMNQKSTDHYKKLVGKALGINSAIIR
jgi:hypothetical protein